jgi:hypothetical protein
MHLEIARPHSTDAPIVVGTARYVLLPLANLLTGYSVKAMERKIERGDWQEGKVWKRAPDGRIVALKREKEAKGNGKTKS